MKDWTWTRAGRRFRQRVVDPLSHETYRRMIRETYPASLDRVGPGWLDRWGHELVPPVRVAPEDQDEVYAAQVDWT